MASGSSGRVSVSGSKAFDFASDDILCSYEDYGNQDGSNGSRSDPSATANSAKEFHKSRMARSSVYPSATYSPPEESSYLHEVIPTVENTMKKNTDNIMRFLEGISSRMSQLELYCYNLDKSIGEMRSDLARNREESDSRFKSLEKHVQEVRRSVQILKDKQELADTQKELTKLHLAQNQSSDVSTTTQKNEEKISTPRKNEAPSKIPENQLALALPHQIAPQNSLPAEHQHPQMPPPPPSSMPPQSMPSELQQQSLYTPPPQIPNINAPSQPQYLPPPPAHSQVNQQQWPQKKQQMPLQPPHPPQMAYSSYIPSQAGREMVAPTSHSMAMQASFAGSSQAIPYGYSSTRNMKVDGYATGGGAHQDPPPPPGSGYMVYDSEGGGMYHHRHSNFQQNAYLPTTNIHERMAVPPQSFRGHPYGDLIEKMMDMGYRPEHVVGVIRRLEESGQTVDFNHVLDRLNGLSGGGGGGSQIKGY